MLTLNNCVHSDLWDERFSAKQKLTIKYDLLSEVNIFRHLKGKMFLIISYKGYMNFSFNFIHGEMNNYIDTRNKRKIRK